MTNERCASCGAVSAGHAYCIGCVCNGRARACELEDAVCIGYALTVGLTALGEWARRCSRPLTGAELAERRGFEPVPEHRKDPFERAFQEFPDGGTK